MHVFREWLFPKLSITSGQKLTSVNYYQETGNTESVCDTLGSKKGHKVFHLSPNIAYLMPPSLI